MGKDIETTFPYLERNMIYGRQKPFATDFIPKLPNVMLTNHVFDFMDVVVHDAQSSRNQFSLDKHGFCFLSSSTALNSEDAQLSETVQRLYYPEVEEVLHKAFPEYSRLDCLDHQV